MTPLGVYMGSHTPHDSSSQVVYSYSHVQEAVSVCWKTRKQYYIPGSNRSIVSSH